MTVSIGLKKSHATAMTSRMSVVDVMLFTVITRQERQKNGRASDRNQAGLGRLLC